MDLKVDPSELRVASLAHGRDGPAEDRHVIEENALPLGRQVEELVSARNVGDEHAVSGQVLKVSDDRGGQRVGA